MTLIEMAEGAVPEGVGAEWLAMVQESEAFEVARAALVDKVYNPSFVPVGYFVADAL